MFRIMKFSKKKMSRAVFIIHSYLDGNIRDRKVWESILIMTITSLGTNGNPTCGLGGGADHSPLQPPTLGLR